MAIARGEQIAAWVVAARDGDHAAFEHLVRQFQDAVTAVVLARAGPGPEIEDIAQDAFLAAFRQLGDFADPANFGPWVCGIARNLTRRWLRDRPRRAALPDDLAARPAPQPPELAERIMAAVRGMPERLGEPLTLFYINGYSTDEVAGLLEIPAGTVRRRLHEARNRLRQYAEENMADEIKRNAPKRDFAKKVAKRFDVEGPDPETGRSTSISSTDPNFTQEKADAQHRELKALAAAGKFEFIERRESDGPVYLYKFILSDGTCIMYGSDRPIEEGL